MESLSQGSTATARDRLVGLFPDQVILPHSKSFQDTQDSFWNRRQRQKAPACFFKPKNTQQVQTAMLELAAANAPFAIRGGGHSSNADGSSIQDGIQIDLSNIDHVEISNDKQPLRVGPGIHWGDLYKTIEKEGVIAVGGRDASVGVAGFVLGGGISYYSNSHGWGIDNLESVDIVIASGDLVRASRDSYSDLFQALRGGGHNFGVITNFTLKLYPFSGMWGGFHVVDQDYFDQIWASFDEYTLNLNSRHCVLECVGYTKPIADPPIFKSFTSTPHTASTLRFDQYSGLAEEMRQGTDCAGQRNQYWTCSMEYDLDLIKAAYQIWREKSDPYHAKYRMAFDINHITSAMRNKATSEGQQDIYGLSGPNEPLINIMLTGTWDNQPDDEEIIGLSKEICQSIEYLAHKRAKGRSFKYMNYSNQEQDVIAGFGKESQALLNAVSARYDPKGLFQKLHQAGFKLNRSGHITG